MASPGFAELLDELVLRMEVFPFSAFFDYFLLFRFWPLLPKEILFLLNGQHKPASPLKYLLLRTTAYSGSFSCLLPIFLPQGNPKEPHRGPAERGDPHKHLFD